MSNTSDERQARANRRAARATPAAIMDAAAVQAVVDAAVAQAAAQHQADLAAANAANALAIQQAIAAIPPAPVAAGAAAVPAAAFALTPGLANPGQPWDYTSSEGLKIYTHASAKLSDTPFNGGIKALKVLLVATGQRGEAYGWNELFTVSNQAAPIPVNKNLLTQYGVLTNDNVRAHGTAIVGAANRLEQMSVQVKNAIMATLGPDMLIKLLARKDEYTVDVAGVSIAEGTMMIKVLTSIVFIQTRATITVIRNKLRELPALMKAEKSNITKFNSEVDDMITSLLAMDQECNDILSNLFGAYQAASDATFRKYIKDEEVKWENGETLVLTADQLMQKADARYKVLIEKKEWSKPTKEETDLMAMKAAIELEAHQTEVKKPGKKKDSKPTRTPRENAGEWDWKNHAPTANESKEKVFKGKTYVHCKFHKNTQWVLKDGHQGGCRLDPNFIKDNDKTPAATTTEKKPHSKQVLQYAEALMAAIQHESSGGFGGADQDE